MRVELNVAEVFGRYGFNTVLPTHSRHSAGMAKGGPQHSWDGFQHDYVITVRSVICDIPHFTSQGDVSSESDTIGAEITF